MEIKINRKSNMKELMQGGRNLIMIILIIIKAGDRTGEKGAPHQDKKSLVKFPLTRTLIMCVFCVGFLSDPLPPVCSSDLYTHLKFMYKSYGRRYFDCGPILFETNYKLYKLS
uniref:Uncharacterized protein n=1 Tax=Cacopsylla melanoneura TaxID=428564 RepID=A0A8D8X3A8_9HEMI